MTPASTTLPGRNMPIFTRSLIDNVTISGSMLTVNFSSNDPAIIPEVLVSLYGWDSKNFIVASHTSDGSTACLDRRGNPGGCSMEYTPESVGGSANPLFTRTPRAFPGTGW